MANTISSYLMPRIIGEAREALSETMALVASLNIDTEQVAAQRGQTVSIPVPANLSATDVTAANTAPAPSDITIGYKSVTLSNFKKASFALTGKEVQDYELSSAFVRQIREAVRAVVYAMNASVNALYYKIPYAVGDAGTGAFASSLDLLADADKMLTDHKCPLMGRKAVVSTKDYAAILKLSEVQNANQAGSDLARRLGILPGTLGFDVLRDQQIGTHTKGTITGNPTMGAAATSTNQTTITCDADDSIALKAGDIIEVDGAQYAVQSDLTVGNSSTGTLTVDRNWETALDGDEALAFASTDATFDANTLNCIAGDLTGISMALRLPAQEVFGYSVQGDHYPVTDPVTGITLDLGIYPQYHQVAFEVAAIWGVDVTDTRKLVRLLTYSS